MLPGSRSANPQPCAIASSDQGWLAGRELAARGRNPAPGRGENRTINGTGRDAFAGTVKVAWISTVTWGYLVLSTCPTSVFVRVGMSPTAPFFVSVTFQSTRETSLGIRP